MRELTAEQQRALAAAWLEVRGMSADSKNIAGEPLVEFVIREMVPRRMQEAILDAMHFDISHLDMKSAPCGAVNRLQMVLDDADGALDNDTWDQLHGFEFNPPIDAEIRIRADTRQKLIELIGAVEQFIRPFAH